MEIRLCSIDASVWLQDLGGEVPCAAVSIPDGIGLSITNALKRRLCQCEKLSELKAEGAEGVVLATSGVVFESPGFVASVAHALACASQFGAAQALDPADEVEAFVFGRGQYGSDVPPFLRDAGVYSVLRREISDRLGSWVEAVDRDEYLSEVRDLHGREYLDSYSAAALDLGNILASVRVHGTDVCCWSKGMEFLGARP